MGSSYPKGTVATWLCKQSAFCCLRTNLSSVLRKQSEHVHRLAARNMLRTAWICCRRLFCLSFASTANLLPFLNQQSTRHALSWKSSVRSYTVCAVGSFSCLVGWSERVYFSDKVMVGLNYYSFPFVSCNTLQLSKLLSLKINIVGPIVPR